MRKIIFLCFRALLASCSSDEGLQDIGTNGKELANMINDYELVLKGYSIDELKKEKDELTPTTQEETVAEPWLIKAIQDSIAQIQFSYNNHTRTDAGAYTRAAPLEGVFKYETCGRYREFVYHMDCEDGGDTYSTGNIGATRVDGNGNVEFHFCVIPAGYATGGVLAFYLPNLYAQNMHVVKRHHDNEDHNNKNHIIDNAGLASFGPNYFNNNTGFFWLFGGGTRSDKLPFKFGVIGTAPLPGPHNILWIDDENGKNANQAIRWSESNNAKGVDLPAEKSFYGLTPGRNTIYEIIQI